MIDIDAIHYLRGAVAKNPSPEVRVRRSEWRKKNAWREKDAPRGGLASPEQREKQPEGVGMQASRGGAESPLDDYTAEPSHRMRVAPGPGAASSPEAGTRGTPGIGTPKPSGALA